MSADSRANSNDESKDSLANMPSIQCANAMIFVSGKQRKGEGAADAQIWTWKSHRERVPETEQIEPGYNISRRRAQNRAAQKAFRLRQKRTYRGLEIQNEELTSSLREALQEINRLRSLMESMSLEMKKHKHRTSACSAKCRSQAKSARSTKSSPQCLSGERENSTSFGPVLHAPFRQLHTNACLFQSTANITGDQCTSQFSASSNEAVATIQSAKQMCVTLASSSHPSIPNHEGLHASHRALQARTPESALWLLMDATLSVGQLDTSTSLGSLSCSSTDEMEHFCRNMMDCVTCSFQEQDYDFYSTSTSNFAPTPSIDNDPHDTPWTSPHSNSDILQLCTSAPQGPSPSDNVNCFPDRFSASLDAVPAASSDITIPSCFGLGEADWFEVPY